MMISPETPSKRDLAGVWRQTFPSESWLMTASVSLVTTVSARETTPLPTYWPSSPNWGAPQLSSAVSRQRFALTIGSFLVTRVTMSLSYSGFLLLTVLPASILLGEARLGRVLRGETDVDAVGGAVQNDEVFALDQGVDAVVDGVDGLRLDDGAAADLHRAGEVHPAGECVRVVAGSVAGTDHQQHAGRLRGAAALDQHASRAAGVHRRDPRESVDRGREQGGKALLGVGYRTDVDGGGVEVGCERLLDAVGLPQVEAAARARELLVLSAGGGDRQVLTPVEAEAEAVRESQLLELDLVDDVEAGLLLVLEDLVLGGLRVGAPGGVQHSRGDLDDIQLGERPGAVLLERRALDEHRLCADLGHSPSSRSRGPVRMGAPAPGSGSGVGRADDRRARE